MKMYLGSKLRIISSAQDRLKVSKIVPKTYKNMWQLHILQITIN